MFTVIFAEKETMRLFEEIKMFFGPLYHPENVVFCEWDKEARDFDSMVPKLYDHIEYQKEWRALVLYDDGCEQMNPFDYTNYRESFQASRNVKWEALAERRNRRIQAYELAVTNPLVRLTTALAGVPNIKTVMSREEVETLVSGEQKTYEYMLRQQLEALNCSEVAARLGRYQRQELRKFVAEDQIEELIYGVQTMDVSGITALISDTDILEFIKFLGNDPLYYDPEYTECVIENTWKNELLRQLSEHYYMKDKLPAEILCFSTRTFNFERVEQDIKWKKKDEVNASRFADFNLYPNKLKYILFDTLKEENKQYKFEQIKLLCLLLLISNNEIPNGLMNAEHVYRAQIEFNNDIVTEICENYLSKLQATKVLLKDIEKQKERDCDVSVDDKTAQRLFESSIVVPVKMNSEHGENGLYAEHRGLGLATDCPRDEKQDWNRQYRDINKRFVRYLREPRRAVKTAVTEGFRENNKIEDDRALHLSEYQMEDVKFHLSEVEQKMVETSTTHLFNTKKFMEQIQQADEQIQQEISHRMTRKKTIIAGIVALVAYFIGFLPLILPNMNNTKSLVGSLAITACLIGLFMLIGFVYLFLLRKRLIRCFRHFNMVMGNICNEINGALGRFSNYISYACNLMRDFSVLQKKDSVLVKTKKILNYHNMCISNQMKSVHEMFSKYIDFSKIRIKECEPYDYDFTVLREYEYNMPNIQVNKKISYLQAGNEIIIPVDYVDSITITREEFYD